MISIDEKSIIKTIENYTNLLAIAYNFAVILPFIHKSFSKYKFQSPQEIKNTISYQISKELILGTFVQKIQKSEINQATLEAINSCIVKMKLVNFIVKWCRSIFKYVNNTKAITCF